MMKRYGLICLLAMVLLPGLAASAGETLDDWEPSTQNEVLFTPTGDSLNISASGGEGEAYGSVSKPFEDKLGIAARVRVTDASGEGRISLRREVGTTPTGNRLQVEVWLDAYNGDYRVRYRVRERDSDGKTLRVLAQGYLGETTGVWAPGEEVLIAFASFQNEIWFFSSRAEALIKVQPLVTLEALAGDFQIYTWVMTGTQNSISATVDSVTFF